MGQNAPCGVQELRGAGCNGGIDWAGIGCYGKGSDRGLVVGLRRRERSEMVPIATYRTERGRLALLRMDDHTSEAVRRMVVRYTVKTDPRAAATLRLFVPHPVIRERNLRFRFRGLRHVWRRLPAGVVS